MAESDELLIENVREYSILYDPENRYYHDTNRKENAWEEIAKNVGCSVADCKKTWTSLRDNFRKALKNRKTKSGQANIVKKKWKYEEIMSFMIPFYKERDQKSNLEETYSQLQEIPSVSLEDESNEGTCTEQSESSRPVSRDSPMSPLSVYSAPSRSIQGKRQHNSPMAQVLQNYFEQKQSTKKARKEDHLQKFFDAMQETVRTFTPYLQIEIKSKIYNLVSEYELKNLMGQQQSTSGNMHFQPQVGQCLLPQSSQPQQNISSSLYQQSSTFVSSQNELYDSSPNNININTQTYHNM